MTIYKYFSNSFIIFIIDAISTNWATKAPIPAIPNTNANNIILPFVAPNLKMTG